MEEFTCFPSDRGGKGFDDFVAGCLGIEGSHCGCGEEVVSDGE
jgi:hypothetical protein